MCYEISSNVTQLQEFIEVFGQRFVGLVDNQGVYSTYRVPYPEAPYPQDYIIDQQGNIAYWSDQYDPQEIIRVIDSLLTTQVDESDTPIPKSPDMELNVAPNPVTRDVRIAFSTGESGVLARVGIYDVSGRLVYKFPDIVTNAMQHTVLWPAIDRAGHKVSAGLYHVRFTAGQDAVSSSFILTR